MRAWVLDCSRALSALCRVLSINMATVMGPTPPGTGVIAPATLTASENSTSPTHRLPDFLVSSFPE